jgi:hypothetical protein
MEFPSYCFTVGVPFHEMLSLAFSLNFWLVCFTVGNAHGARGHY